MSKANPTEYLVISTSLRSGSLSRIMAGTVQREYENLGAPNRLIDLRDHALPICDGGPAYDHPDVKTLTEVIAGARVIILAMPVYNFNASAAAKNLIELTGSAWENKVVGFLCAAGGALSYMSVMSLANSMMLDFRCLIIPRFVYAKGDDFTGNQEPSDDLAKRLRDLAAVSMKIRNG